MPQLHDPAAFAAAYKLAATAIGSGTGDARFDDVIWLEASPTATKMYATNGAAFIRVTIPTTDGAGDSWRSIVSTVRSQLAQVAGFAANPKPMQSLFGELDEQIIITRAERTETVRIELASAATVSGQTTTRSATLDRRDLAIDWPNELISKIGRHDRRPTLGTVYSHRPCKFLTAVTGALPPGMGSFTTYSDGQAEKFEFTDPSLLIEVMGIAFLPEPEAPSQVVRPPADRERPPVFVNQAS